MMTRASKTCPHQNYSWCIVSNSLTFRADARGHSPAGLVQGSCVEVQLSFQAGQFSSWSVVL